MHTQTGHCTLGESRRLNDAGMYGLTALLLDERTDAFGRMRCHRLELNLLFFLVYVRDSFYTVWLKYTWYMISRTYGYTQATL